MIVRARCPQVSGPLPRTCLTVCLRMRNWRLFFRVGRPRRSLKRPESGSAALRLRTKRRRTLHMRLRESFSPQAWRRPRKSTSSFFARRRRIIFFQQRRASFRPALLCPGMLELSMSIMSSVGGERASSGLTAYAGAKAALGWSQPLSGRRSCAQARSREHDRRIDDRDGDARAHAFQC